MTLKIFLLSLLICSTLHAFQPVYDIGARISSLKVKKGFSYYESVINDIIEVMKNYAYINILKSPPKVNGSDDYFQRVDIIQDLENLKGKINDETDFYEFYQKIMKIIGSAKDYHIIFGYVGQEEPWRLFTNFFICSPIEFEFQKNRKVLGKINRLIKSNFNPDVFVENHTKINDNYENKTDIIKINNINVFEYIATYCSNYIQFKSKTSKFVWNRENIKITRLFQCPLNPEEISYFNITYSNGITISSKFIGFENDIATENIKNDIFNYQSTFNFELKPNIGNQEYTNTVNEKNAVDWDINIGNRIKCKVDHNKEVNVIYQNSFSPSNEDPIGIINNISYCHGNFSSNDYPLIVIENLNAGGYAQLSKLMQQLVQDLMKPKNYFSIIHNEQTKDFIMANKESFLFVDDKEKENLTIYDYYYDQVSEDFGNITIERSKQRLLLDLNFESLIKGNIFKRNKIKKPTDVIVFTDGLSFSATSVFIKNLYYFGGAILVGYGGNPEDELFDASQNPTFVLTNFTGIKGYDDLFKKGFAFYQIPVGPMYRTKYDEKDENIPEEFTVNYIDERVNLYNAYDDSLYEDFVEEAKKIFDKYKNKCNPNNKYLKYLSDECTFENNYTHGGYICDENGYWSNICAPFYCDEDYYFDYVSQKCILWNTEEENINVNTIKTYSINYLSDTVFNLNYNDISDDVIVNMYSKNCKIKIEIENVDTNDKIINQMNDDTFSFTIKPHIINTTKVKVTPLIYSIDERIRENLKTKTCSLIISNYQVNDEKIPTLKLMDDANIYFHENNKKIQFIYKINEEALDIPIALSLSFNQKSQFKITINLSGNENSIIDKEIFNSTNIFFDKKFKEGEQLIIDIEHMTDISPIFMKIKLIKKTLISMLEQNNINYGFITSNIEYQYYYMEVFKEQEGEIMLHNKRQTGILIADLKEKNKSDDLNDINIYPKHEKATPFKFNEHSLKLTFNYNQTSKCESGCYLLITYYKKIYDLPKEEDDLVGYEYTIFSRIWDYMENSPEILNIPFNEYIFGSFDKYSINHHYYSMYIPNDTEKIIIQLEGNYLDGFIGEGIVKLNTMKVLEKVKNLNIINNQNVLTLTKDDLKFDFKNNYVSFAFRSKDYFEDVYSFYYFRVFYLKAKEALYYPVDSNFGNLCLPTEKENGKFYCNLILNNNYNDFSSQFAISGTNQIEYFRIYYSIIYKNREDSKLDNNYQEFKYINKDTNQSKEIDYFIFQFEFSEYGIKTIIAAFSDKSTTICPQIYSARLYYFFNITKTFYHYLTHDYKLDYKWIGGWVGKMNFNMSKFSDVFFTRNFRGKPIGLHVTDKMNNFTFSTQNDRSEYIFYLKLNYNIKNKGIEEIISGETKSELMTEGFFPIYYYLNLKKKENVNVDINVRLNSFDSSLLKNDFEVKGYIVNEDDIKRKLRGETIILKDDDAIYAKFSEGYNLGILQIDKNFINNDQYILISITNKVISTFDTELLIEIVNNEYQDRYFMPINQYIIETFNHNQSVARNENKYCIDINDITAKGTSILVEFSPNYNDLELSFETPEIKTDISIVSGFQKYRIIESNHTMINFTVKNIKNRIDANYILRYFYTYVEDENNYILDEKYDWKDENNTDTISKTLIFNNINIMVGPYPVNISSKYNITFFVMAYLYPNQEKQEELVNTSTLINQRQYLYKAEASSIYGYDKYITLYFKNISREHNYDYTLQLRVNVYIANNIFNEEFLTYTLDQDLKYLKVENGDSDPGDKSYIWIIFLVAGLLVIIAIAFFFIYRKLRKDNAKLKDKVLSISYSSGIEKNVLLEEKKAKKDEDFESTFI